MQPHCIPVSRTEVTRKMVPAHVGRGATPIQDLMPLARLLCLIASEQLSPFMAADSSPPNSPHLQAARTKAQFLIAIADNDDKRSPNDKTVLKRDVC